MNGLEGFYRKRWGDASRRARFEVDGLIIEVAKWAADANPEGVALYATLGASSQPTQGRGPAHQVEFFVGLLPEQDHIASALAALGLYSSRHGVALNHGDTVPAEGPLWPGTPMRTFLIVRPLRGFLSPLDQVDELHVDFLQAIPLFDQERVFKSEQGVDGLLQRWERDAVAFWNSERGPFSN